MESLKVLFALLFFISSTYSFQCDSLYTGRRCGEYDSASKSLKEIVKVADDAIADAFNFIGSEAADAYSTTFPMIDNSTIVVKGNMTAEEALQLVNQLMKMLKDLEGKRLVGLEELEKINELISEALKGALKPNPNAYINLGPLDIEQLKEFVRNSLSGVSSIVKTLLMKAIDRAHGRVKLIGKVIEPILRTFGYGDLYDKIKAKIDMIVALAKGRAEGAGYNIVQQIVKAENDVIVLLDGLDQQAPIVKRGVKDLWEKVEAALNKLGNKVKQSTKDLVNKYKPKIVESLNKVKTVIVDGTQKIILKLQGDIVKILTQEKTVSKRSITDVWGKIKEATKNLGANIKDAVKKAIAEHKPKVIEALKNVKKVVIDGAKKIVIELNNGVVSILTQGQTATSDKSLYSFVDAHHSVYVVIDDSASSVYGLRDVWAKVKQTIKKLGDKLKPTTKQLLEKYKHLIVKSLSNVKQFVIEEGKKIVIEMKGDVVKIFVAVTDVVSQKSVVKRGLTDVWGKIKEATKNLGANIKDAVKKAIAEHKPKVIEALNIVKKVVIDGVKKIVIELNNGVVSILTQGQTATSDKSLYSFVDSHHDIYVELTHSEPATYAFLDVWNKVKSAVANLSSVLKERVMKAIEQYKPQVVTALNNVQRVVIDSGKKIIIEVTGSVVRVITEGLEGISS